MICHVIDDWLDKRFIYDLDHKISYNLNCYDFVNIANRRTWPYGQEGSHRLMGCVIFQRENLNRINILNKEAPVFFDIFERIENILNSKYRKIFNHVIKDNMREFSNIKDLVEKEKDSIYQRVKEKGQPSVDISNKKQMQNYYKDIFGKQSKTISFDDYVALLEMKRLLEIDEQIEIADVEEI